MYDLREIQGFEKGGKKQVDARSCCNCAKSIRNRTQSFVDDDNGKIIGCAGCTNHPTKGPRLHKWVGEVMQDATE